MYHHSLSFPSEFLAFTGSSSRHTTTTTSSSSPTDTLGSNGGGGDESPAFMGLADHLHLHYDPHSSEEELEVINGPSNSGVGGGGGSGGSGNVSNDGSNGRCTSGVADSNNGNDTGDVDGDDGGTIRGGSSRGGASLDDDDNVFESPQRSCSVIVENRKRSLAQCSDDDVSIFVLFMVTW